MFFSEVLVQICITAAALRLQVVRAQDHCCKRKFARADDFARFPNDHSTYCHFCIISEINDVLNPGRHVHAL